MGERNSVHCVDHNTEILLIDNTSLPIKDLDVVAGYTYDLALATPPEVVEPKNQPGSASKIKSFDGNPVVPTLRFTFKNPPECLFEIFVKNPAGIITNRVTTTAMHSIRLFSGHYVPAAIMGDEDEVELSDKPGVMSDVDHVAPATSESICSLVVMCKSQAAKLLKRLEDQGGRFLPPGFDPEDFIGGFLDFLEQFIGNQEIAAGGGDCSADNKYGLGVNDLTIYGNGIPNGTLPIHWVVEDLSKTAFPAPAIDAKIPK